MVYKKLKLLYKEIWRKVLMKKASPSQVRLIFIELKHLFHKRSKSSKPEIAVEIELGVGLVQLLCISFWKSLFIVFIDLSKLLID